MLRVVLLSVLFMTLMACSNTPEWKGVYKIDQKDQDNSKLEVPPDLSQPNVSDNLALPNIASGQSTYTAYSKTEGNTDAILSAKPQGVKVVRDGSNQWVEINSSADKLWSELRVFFSEVGFELKREDKALGVMETNWVENYAEVPTNWFSKLLKRFSSTGLRDKYRARLEKTDNPNVTRVFITHQGLRQQAVEENFAITKWWETRPSEPELEAEMYQRFLIFRDMGKDAAKKLVAKIEAKERTHLIERDGTKMLQVGEGFDRTWRRVGIALDRIGLLVDDRNRSGGLYYLRITDDFRDKVKEEKGWLSGLFSGDKVNLKERYLLNVREENGNSIISLYETTGAKADDRFVEKLLVDLKTYLD